VNTYTKSTVKKDRWDIYIENSEIIVGLLFNLITLFFKELNYTFKI